VTTARQATVAVVWRGDEDAERRGLASNERLRPVVEALARRGAGVELVVYRDAVAHHARERLLGVDAVLVWVDPIGGGEDRAVIDAVLREVSNAGVFVSAHPDTIAAMGTKDVLFATRHLGWATQIDRYADAEDFYRRFPASLATGPRVLKQHRGNGGTGVWKIDVVRRGDGAVGAPDSHTLVRVQHAEIRDTRVEELSLGVFMERCRPYFDGGRPMIDQQFQSRVREGLVRAYLVGDEVVGFSRQGAESILGRDDDAAVMGLPSPKTMFPPAAPTYAELRRRLETDWVPALQSAVGLDTAALPLLWDADFLLGPRDDQGADTYVLCEINVSCVTPFPPEAVEPLARATLARAHPL
jgi:hypothetical protein